MTYLKTAILMAGTALFASVLSASAGSPAETFAAMDVDADGLVSETEFVAYTTRKGEHTAETASAKFASIAGDDLALTLAELEASELVRDTRSDGQPQGS
ncbi:MAG: hypothetical protein AAFQ84_07440 [Pseudomonadota bacterium]